MADMIILKSKIKKYAKGCRVAENFIEGLNKKVIDLVSNSADRARTNKRKTIDYRDL